MKLDVRNIKFHPGHDDSHSYTAVIYVDGVKAFSAFNDGWGGPDNYSPVDGYTGPSQNEIDAWLESNEPLTGEYAGKLKNCLEFIVGDELNKAAVAHALKKERAKYERMLKTQICGIKDGGLVTWPKKYAPTPANIASLLKSKHSEGVVILNGADEATQAQGFKVYCPDIA